MTYAVFLEREVHAARRTVPGVTSTSSSRSIHSMQRSRPMGGGTASELRQSLSNGLPDIAGIDVVPFDSH